MKKQQTTTISLKGAAKKGEVRVTRESKQLVLAFDSVEDYRVIERIAYASSVLYHPNVRSCSIKVPMEGDNEKKFWACFESHAAAIVKVAQAKSLMDRLKRNTTGMV